MFPVCQVQLSTILGGVELPAHPSHLHPGDWGRCHGTTLQPGLLPVASHNVCCCAGIHIFPVFLPYIA